MIVAATSSYNIIFGSQTFNALMVAISYPHLCLTYPLPNGRVRVVQGDQAMAHEYYTESAKVKTV